MRSKKIRIFMFTVLFFVSTIAVAMEPLSDLRLDAVVAGSLRPVADSTKKLTRIPIRYIGEKGSVDGEIFVLPMNQSVEQSTLQITDNAQSSLRSLININAVNSPVQVLLNLNININSTIGSVTQLNDFLSSSVQ